MPAPKARMIVGWRQIPVAKVRVRPVREAPAPRDVATGPTVPATDPPIGKR